MDEIAREASRVSGGAGLEASEIIARLGSKRPGDRVVGLAAVRATADPATLAQVLQAAKNPEIPFEQYCALRALESLRPGLTPKARRQVVTMLRDRDRRDGLEGDTSRIAVADRLLRASEPARPVAPTATP